MLTFDPAKRRPTSLRQPLSGRLRTHRTGGQRKTPQGNLRRSTDFMLSTPILPPTTPDTRSTAASGRRVRRRGTRLLAIGFPHPEKQGPLSHRSNHGEHDTHPLLEQATFPGLLYHPRYACPIPCTSLDGVVPTECGPFNLICRANVVSQGVSSRHRRPSERAILATKLVAIFQSINVLLIIVNSLYRGFG